MYVTSNRAINFIPVFQIYPPIEISISIMLKSQFFKVLQTTGTASLREKCPNAEIFLVHIFLNSDQKKLPIWALSTQCIGGSKHFSNHC